MNFPRQTTAAQFPSIKCEILSRRFFLIFFVVPKISYLQLDALTRTKKAYKTTQVDSQAWEA